MMALKISAKVPETFEALKGELVGDRAHCAVIAIAAITRLPAKQVQEALAKAGRNPRCGTSRTVSFKALDALGFKVTRLGQPFLRSIIDTYPGRATKLENVTTHHPRRFPAAWAGQPDMLMFTSGHVLSFVDGQIVDWTIQHSKQVNQVWLVEKKPEAAEFMAWPAIEESV
jgi:hypothetical protein